MKATTHNVRYPNMTLESAREWVLANWDAEIEFDPEIDMLESAYVAVFDRTATVTDDDAIADAMAELKRHFQP